MCILIEWNKGTNGQKSEYESTCFLLSSSLSLLAALRARHTLTAWETNVTDVSDGNSSTNLFLILFSRVNFGGFQTVAFYLKQEKYFLQAPLHCWFGGDVTATVLVVKNLWSELHFYLNSWEKNFSVLSTNMAALSRVFKPRISRSGYQNTTVLRRIIMSFRGWYWWRVHLGWRIRGRVSPEFKTWSGVHSQHGQCRTQHKRLAVFHYCGTNGEENQSSSPNRQCAWYLSYELSLLALVSISFLLLRVEYLDKYPQGSGHQ